MCPKFARCFTGWTMKNPHDGSGFFFDIKKHDRGVKHVLGHTIKAGRGVEGTAKRSSTSWRAIRLRRTFVAMKLVQHFVADSYCRPRSSTAPPGDSARRTAICAR